MSLMVSIVAIASTDDIIFRKFNTDNILFRQFNSDEWIVREEARKEVINTRNWNVVRRLLTSRDFEHIHQGKTATSTMLFNESWDLFPDVYKTVFNAGNDLPKHLAPSISAVIHALTNNRIDCMARQMCLPFHYRFNSLGTEGRIETWEELLKTIKEWYNHHNDGVAAHSVIWDEYAYHIENEADPGILMTTTWPFHEVGDHLVRIEFLIQTREDANLIVWLMFKKIGNRYRISGIACVEGMIVE
jgi:hypothetical protein